MLRLTKQLIDNNTMKVYTLADDTIKIVTDLFGTKLTLWKSPDSNFIKPHVFEDGTTYLDVIANNSLVRMPPETIRKCLKEKFKMNLTLGEVKSRVKYLNNIMFTAKKAIKSFVKPDACPLSNE